MQLKTTNVFLLSVASLFTMVSCTKETEKEEETQLPGNIVTAIYPADDGLVYFATDKGLASYDGAQWQVYTDNEKVAEGPVNAMDFEQTTYGPELWLGTNQGVNVISIPVDATSGATTFTRENTQTLYPAQPTLPDDTVSALRVDDNHIRWFATKEGLSAFSANQWREINFNGHYLADFFKNNPVTSFDYNNDTMYIGTLGGGVARMIASSPDAISGASPYEIPWSFIPSANILSVFVDGSTQWYGTDMGVGQHNGTEAKENWIVYSTNHGLVNNVVQAIAKDLDGHMWFGTRGGLSEYDGTNFTSYTTTEGLVGNNVLSIAVAHDGSLWIGTDNGVSHFDGLIFTNHRADD